MSNRYNPQEDNRLDDLIRSLDGMKRAKPRPSLYRDIVDSLSERQRQAILIPLWKIAVAATVLLALNITAVQQYQKETSINSGNYKDTYLVADSYISDYNFYDL